ncbi:MAG: type II CAAX endopeptidase family protein [Terriglobales bacterium]|jgi:membrane protease YdiL (CAAX protease family)
METPRPEQSRNRVVKEAGAYIALAFGFSWVATIGAIKLGLAEEYLNIGTAGPAVAAYILARNQQPTPNDRSKRKWLWFVLFLSVCWIVLSLHYLWWNGAGLGVHLRPLLLIPSILPAFILFGVLARDQGVRGLTRRLLHAPDKWSAFALLYFPVVLGIPSAIAYVLGARMIWPNLGGFTVTAVANATMFFLYNLLFVAVLEEPGWRGFLLDRLETRFAPLAASLLVWFPWALWHAPVDYYRPVRFTWVEEILLRVVFMIPTTIILTWLYNRSGRSIQATAIFHAAMNTFPYVVPYYQMAWLLMFAFAAYAIIADKMWRKHSACLMETHE